MSISIRQEGKQMFILMKLANYNSPLSYQGLIEALHIPSYHRAHDLVVIRANLDVVHESQRHKTPPTMPWLKCKDAECYPPVNAEVLNSLLKRRTIPSDFTNL